MEKYSHLIGQTFGDFVVDRCTGSDSSGHKLYAFKCKHCGYEFVTSPYEVIRGRKSIDCPKCDDTESHAVKICPVVKDLNDDEEGNITIPADFFDNINLPEITHEDDNDEILNTDTLHISIKHCDLFSMPCYYHIAHAIPSSLRFRGGAIARTIDSYYNMSECIEEAEPDFEWHTEGEVFRIANVFNLVMGHRDINGKYIKPDADLIRSIFRTLACDCYNYHIRYLAMPKIACGHNGMNWDDVQEILVEAFEEVYNQLDKDDESFINIVICDP